MAADGERIGRPSSLPTKVVLFARAVAERFYRDNCLTDASALAYATLLSLVPLLALMFAVLKGLGAQNLLQPSSLMSFGIDSEVAGRILAYIDNVNVGTIGSMGAAALALTVISLLGGIEAAFNRIWRVRHSRNLLRKISDYMSVVFLTPLLLLAAAAITSSLQFQYVLERLLATQVVGDAVLLTLRLVPILINSLALGILYSVLPNRRASPIAVAIAATLAGFTWQLVQLNYLALQVGLARYSAVYGALAQRPFTLVWLYVSWVVILAGAQIAAVYEFGAARGAPANVPSQANLALHLLTRAADAFRAGAGPADIVSLAAALDVGRDQMEEVAAFLVERGWLVPVEGGEGCFVLARAPESISLGLLADKWAGDSEAGIDERVKNCLSSIAAAEYRLWDEHDLASVLDARSEALRDETPHLDKRDDVG